MDYDIGPFTNSQCTHQVIANGPGPPAHQREFPYYDIGCDQTTHTPPLMMSDVGMHGTTIKIADSHYKTYFLLSP